MSEAVNNEIQVGTFMSCDGDRWRGVITHDERLFIEGSDIDWERREITLEQRYGGLVLDDAEAHFVDACHVHYLERCQRLTQPGAPA